MRVKAREEKWIGYSPDAAWFCGVHIGEAKKLVHLTIDDVIKSARAKFEIC
jgi:hypothetical protein